MSEAGTSGLAAPMLGNATLDFQAKLRPSHLGYGDAESMGRGVLEVTAEGMVFTKKKRWGKSEPIGIAWSDLRELENRLREKGYFRANIGADTDDVLVKVSIREGDTAKLAEVLDALPEYVKQPKCPACAGPVFDGTCDHCGKSLATQHRKAGLAAIAVGAIVGGLGVALTSAEFLDRIWWGLVLVGVLTVIWGLLSVVTGRR